MSPVRSILHPVSVCCIVQTVRQLDGLGRSDKAFAGAQGPEIRTGFLEDASKPVKLSTGKEVTLTTDYEAKGTQDLIACRWDLELQSCCFQAQCF